MTTTAPPSTGTEYGDPTIAYSCEILRTTVGSGVHGIAVAGTDDHDEMGVFIEPLRFVTGVGEPEMSHYIWRTQPEGARSGPGDVDRVLYSLRRYLQLAVKGNPTALLPLFAPPPDIIVNTQLGQQLRDLKREFLSTEAAERFLGYMHSQRERMMGRGRRSAVPNRPELVERYGWDVKYGSHALRLAYQCRELVVDGWLTLPMRETERLNVLEVKQGRVARDDVDAEIVGIAADLRDRLDRRDTPLPPTADLARISQWSQDAHLTAWGVRW